MVRASLIVLNYQGRDVIEQCLTSLARASGADDEIIVVDNASTDGSLELVRRFGERVQVVSLPTNTYIFGLNAGLAVARGEFVAFLNNDMTVDDDFVDATLREFETGSDVFAVCPRILESTGLDQGSRTRGFWHRGLIFYESLPHSTTSTDCFFAVGGQSFFRRSMLEQLGSIDPLLHPMYHEDVELSYRAWKRGWRIRYAPDGVAHHIGGHSSKRTFTPHQLRSFVRQNEYLTVWKNITDKTLLLEHVFLIPLRLATAIARGDWATPVGFGRALRRLPLALERRRVARAQMTIADRQVLNQVSRIA